jgi:hypothetical protein
MVCVPMSWSSWKFRTRRRKLGDELSEFDRGRAAEPPSTRQQRHRIPIGNRPIIRIAILRTPPPTGEPHRECRIQRPAINSCLPALTRHIAHFEAAVTGIPESHSVHERLSITAPVPDIASESPLNPSLVP